MKPIPKLLFAAVAIASAASCAQVDEIPFDNDETIPVNPDIYASVTFTAAHDIESKAVIDDKFNVTWAVGDKVTVFDSEGNSEEFTVEEACSNFEFTSTGILSDKGPYYAITGYGNFAPAFDKEKALLTINRSSTDGSFGQAWTSVSYTESTNFAFRHIYGTFKMAVESDDITAMKFVAKGIAPGSTSIGFGEDGTPDIDYGEPGDEILIEGLSGAGTYYMPAIPGTYSDGFAINIYFASQTLKASANIPVTLNFNRLLNFGTLDTRDDLQTVNAFLDESVWGVYRFNPASGDVLTRVYQYCEGTDQYAFSGTTGFRIQCLKDGRLASFTLPDTDIQEGNAYQVSSILYGLEGIEDGAVSKSLSVQKIEDGRIWMTEKDSDYAYIISIK